ncbi:MAG: dTDP-4-dehydrorhamnose reductase [Clostridiaceae bacterium]
MKVLVTGYHGQLGYDVVKLLEEQGEEVLGATREHFDLTDEVKIKEFIGSFKPDVVVHCAAYTLVDKAEDNKELCYAVNVLGTRYIAEACKEANAKMVYISTDYVFDGNSKVPYEVDDKVNPVNYYGETKLQGEDEVKKIVDNHFIIRISWVFGENGNNFVKTMLRLAETRNELNVVGDQYGSPTYTKDLSILIAEMIRTDQYGIYHASNEGTCSWNEFAKAIFESRGLEVKVNSIPTSDYPTRAKRPMSSIMSKDKLEQNGFKRLPDWKDALERYLNQN